MVGLGLAVAAFVGFNLVASEETATAQEAVKEAVSKIAEIPAAITGNSKFGNVTKSMSSILGSKRIAVP